MVYARTLYLGRLSLLLSEVAKNFGSPRATRKRAQIARGSPMPDFPRPQDPVFYRVRIKEGHNAVGLFVSAAGKRCIPSTQFWLTFDAGAAYRFQHIAALRVQVRLGTIGFTTALEEIRD
jgi:hypothetical protein